MKKLKIMPHGDKIYVHLDDFAEQVGSVLVSSRHSERTRLGTIVALGKEAEKDFKAGDRVMISYHTGIRIHLVGYDFDEELDRMIVTYEILAKVEE